MKPISIIYPEFPHRECIEPFFTWLSWGLSELGYPVQWFSNYSVNMGGRAIYLGAHHTPPPSNYLGVIYNTEVVSSPWLSDRYQRLLNTHITWCYSGSLGRRVPLGYTPSLESHYLHNSPRYAHVVHYGSENPRRLEHMRAWTESLQKVKTEHHYLYRISGGVYGKVLDESLKSAACVLNIHYYPNAPVEQARIGYCLANGIAVISEECWDQETFPGPLYIPSWSAAEREEALRHVLQSPRAVGAEQKQAFVADQHRALGALKRAAAGAFGAP